MLFADACPSDADGDIIKRYLTEEKKMSLTVNIYYTGESGNAKSFAEEMLSSKTVDLIRAEEGNEGYEYFTSLEDDKTVLLIDRWSDQKALDDHHKSEMMKTIAMLREKYKLHMRVERFF